MKCTFDQGFYVNTFNDRGEASPCRFTKEQWADILNRLGFSRNFWIVQHWGFIFLFCWRQIDFILTFIVFRFSEQDLFFNNNKNDLQDIFFQLIHIHKKEFYILHNNCFSIFWRDKVTFTKHDVEIWWYELW